MKMRNHIGIEKHIGRSAPALSFALLIALCLVPLAVPTVSAAPTACGVCGDADGSGSIGIVDAVAVLDYIKNNSPVPACLTEADCDDYSGVTVRDACLLNAYLFLGGSAPTCPPTNGGFVPTVNDTMYFPSDTLAALANNISTTINFSNNTSLSGFNFALKVRIGSDIPTINSVTYSPRVLANDFSFSAVVDAPSGTINMTVLWLSDPILTPGSGAFVTLSLSTPAMGSARAIDIDTVHIFAPNTQPMFIRSIANSLQAVAPVFITDPDNDGVDASVDNCPNTYNPAQEDFDNDGKGDDCFMPGYLSPLTVGARFVAPSPPSPAPSPVPSPANPPGDPNVNLRVIDPTGLYIGVDSLGVLTNTIGLGANYYQTAGNDSVVIDEPRSGLYRVVVLPEIDAAPGDKYLVGIRIDGTVELVDQSKLVPNQGERDTVFVNNIPYGFGDGDGDRSVTIGDAVYIIAYIFSGGPAPVPVASADSNCDGTVDIGDAVSLIGYIFLGGTAPGCGP